MGIPLLLAEPNSASAGVFRQITRELMLMDRLRSAAAVV
jgi:hypothetical protein